ncbi:RNA polymerase factor sigma-54 [Thiohalomonas denitrificans]|uniref:RNA polymerase factor sigma-54 n=1 Tax=Thiohalomonas denitrificans TaxID=415747 RepID=UPI0026EC12C8|nr:RNA polymerase factor sigma-54 [Thiohalomonas denitrificans]
MKQSLQLRLGQNLTMTPQLQQAIRMLQLSTLELQIEVQQALESNLMLEETEEPEEESEARDAEREEADAARESDEKTDDIRLDEDAGMPDELPVDSAWEDVYETLSTTPASSGDDDDRPVDYGDTRSESLREHLLWQMQMTPMSEVDQTIAEAIIDAVSDDGLLTLPLEEIHEGLVRQDAEIEFDEVEAVLHRVQNFDPPGVAGRDLRETLLLQARQLETRNPRLKMAIRLLEDFFELLAKRDYNQLKRRLKVDEEELLAVIRVIQSLNPRPGSTIGAANSEYVIPDVIVRKLKGHWRVELNPETAPRLRVNAQYAALIKKMENRSDSTTLKNHLQEARWFIKSLQSRNETLLRVATAIVKHQQEFLERGEVGMKAMVLHDIAEELALHESTISRVTTRKYMHTPRGIFELKYFFSSHVGTADGGEASSTAIRALIKQLVADENAAKPLSDSKITTLLGEKGIKVARRTVAKYREAMAIPPSNERKRLA